MIKLCAVEWMSYLIACYRPIPIRKCSFIGNICSRSLCNKTDAVQTEQANFRKKVAELQTVLDRRINQLHPCELANRTVENTAENMQIKTASKEVTTVYAQSVVQNTKDEKILIANSKPLLNVQQKQSKESLAKSSKKKKSNSSKSVKKSSKKPEKSANSKSKVKNLTVKSINNKLKSADKVKQKNAKMTAKSKAQHREKSPDKSPTQLTDLEFINRNTVPVVTAMADKTSKNLKQENTKRTTKTKLKHHEKKPDKSPTQLADTDVANKNIVSVLADTVPPDVSSEVKPNFKPVVDKKLLLQSASLPFNNTYFTHPHVFLLPYFEVCVFTGMLNRAELMYQKFKYALDVETFNVLLHGYATQGDLNKIRKLFKDMKKVGASPNMQSYVAVLECIGRSGTSSENTAVNCIKQMSKDGLDVNNIFSCTLTEDQRKFISEALETACPTALKQKHFEPLVCQNQLVEDFYCKEEVDSNDFSDRLPLYTDYNILKKNMLRQVKVEEKGHLRVKSVDIGDNISPQVERKRKILNEHEREWKSCLSRAFDEVKFGHNNKSLGGMANFYPFLCLFDTKEYVDIMLQTLHTLATSSEGNARVNLSVELGQRLYHRYVILKKIKTGVSKKINQLYGRYVPWCLKEETLATTLLREKWHQLQHQYSAGASLDTESNVWSRPVILSIGSLLADMMLHEINIDTHLGSSSERQMIPGLYHIFDYRSLKTVGFVKPHPKLVSLIQDACLPNIKFDSNQVPMLSPPLPWSSHKFGGYLFSPCAMMRTRDDSHQVQLLKEKIESADLNPVLDSLNQLSNTPWIVNEPVLDIVLEIFKNGGNEELNIPPPASVCPEPPAYSKSMTSEEMIEIQKLRVSYRKKKSEMHSLRMNEVYKLSIANAFRGKIFWFPHNMDFRGRVYPYPPHFNHLGNDVTRSLLLFGHGKPLGEHGLRWLKIHLVNLTGLKKRASQTERLEFADSLMPSILDSAHDPLEGTKWWQTVENCWQTLAACKEISAAINSPDHTKYICHLPVHQDGSCNGLQHYAALGRDVIGAKQVNLYPMDLPQDVYNGVAQMVEELRAEDAADGNPIAISLKDKIHRKVVKQTVMTVVYGVTAYGGRLQIQKQLKEVKDLTFEQQWAASAYIVVKVFQSLRKMFTKTRQIQDWLTDSAWMISKAGEVVEWETPLGLPVVQPYQKRVTFKPNKSAKPTDPLFSRHKPDTMKQKNAFPPNFIHSLDSAHMMLTSIYCQRAGITFSSVHDCFWTHPNTVDIMNKICRTQFVKLHSEPILADLGESLIRKFGNLPIPSSSKSGKEKSDMELLKDFIEQIPSKGEFDLNNVIHSTYFFS